MPAFFIPRRWSLNSNYDLRYTSRRKTYPVRRSSTKTELFSWLQNNSSAFTFCHYYLDYFLWAQNQRKAFSYGHRLLQIFWNKKMAQNPRQWAKGDFQHPLKSMRTFERLPHRALENKMLNFSDLMAIVSE